MKNRSTEEHPFAFFDWYLDTEIYSDLKEFYRDMTEELYFDNVVDIDKSIHTIRVRNIYHDEVQSEFITFSFEGSIKKKLNQEVNQTKKNIELGFQKRFSDNKERNAYAEFLILKTDSFLNNNVWKEFTFLHSYFEQLNNYIKQYSRHSKNEISTPLSFYFDMLFVNSIQSVKDSFLGNSTLQKKGYIYLQNQNYYLKEEMVEDNGTMPIFVTDIINREDFLRRLLNFENISIYNQIAKEVSSIPNKESNKIYLKNIYNEIQVLLKRVLKFEDDNLRLIEDKLLEIINNLKDRYSSIVTYHDVYKHLIKESDITFFKHKDLKRSFYESLYEVAYELNLIDDIETDELDFINAFTSPNPQVLVNKIRFSKNNYVVAYFLESLKPFFNGFTHIAIEKSEVFLNKQNKAIRSTDIYASLSRGKNKVEEEKKKIDAHIIKLKNEYLK